MAGPVELRGVDAGRASQPVERVVPGQRVREWLYDLFVSLSCLVEGRRRLALLDFRYGTLDVWLPNRRRFRRHRGGGLVMTRWSGLISRVVTEVTNRPGSMMRRAVARWRLRPVGEAVMRRRLAAAGLIFPEQTHPSVSVLIAMHGRPEVTLNALVALMKTACEEPIEILLCDDHSPDGSGRFFAGVPGLRLTKNRENLGYLRSNNLLAADARGEFLLLLNNDTVIQPGALSSLLDVFRTHADAGLVGARLLFPDGRLQEAGADVLRDGRAVRRGWRQRDLPGMYDRIEEVDYCSAAGILIPRRLFLDVGGFDEFYLPAYYEDVDLAFKTRAAGKCVYFQPAARIVHVENASSNFARAAAQTALNQVNFRKKWAEVLDAGDHPSARHRPCSG